ncbi:MAG: family 1 glycosylhydrolase [bacterium]|nr:family 1 glycosylhydrolase [bacterium]
MATKYKFPKRFLWGAATSAHQVEGGTSNQWTSWEHHNAPTLAAQSQYVYGSLDNWDSLKAEAQKPSNYLSGRAVDSYNRIEDDVALIKKMNMNAYRFSIEWSRVEPSENTWDSDAIDHYKDYIKLLKKHDIEPIITLFHFTLPDWFQSIGGFAKRRNVKYFERFARKIVSELGVTIRYIVTINEPEVYASASYYQGDWPPNLTSRYKWWRVINNLAYAHRRVARTIHGLNRRYRVSIAKNSSYFYPGDDAWLSRLSARVMQYTHNDYFLKKVIKSCDYIGLNYYFSNRVYGYRVHNQQDNLSDLAWSMDPSDIQFVLEQLSSKYKLPILITENGLADSDDSRRKWWISETISAMQSARNNGVDLIGYLHWSLLDNFEWNKGYWPKFGLASVNKDTLDRTLRPSAVWFGKIIKYLRQAS